MKINVKKYFPFFVIAGIAILLFWAQPFTSPESIPHADTVIIYKHSRTLELKRGDMILKRYQISLGRNPIGPKEMEGDNKTPEGKYLIDAHKENSGYHRALHLSYPSELQKRNAAIRGVEPGSAIMIHGLPNGLGWLGNLHRWFDWTRGCIALTNAEIEEVYNAVADGTPVIVNP
jgi:murein L,D-transpeptidase YafK